MSGERAARHAIVCGRVQGVAFRYFTRERARELALGGWVRNLSDGRVEVHVEGPSEQVARFVEWLHKGPPAARVETVDVNAVEPEGRLDFEIAR